MYNNLTTGDPQDKRFFGIYRGVVADTADPLNQNRIRMLIPQILGEAVTGWAYPIIGVPENKKVPYGSFVSTSTQTISSTTSNYIIGINTVETAYGVNLVNPATTPVALTGATSKTVPDNTSGITFNYPGVYNVQISAQIDSSIGGNSSMTVDIWMLQNGSPVSDSVGQIMVSAKSQRTVSSWNYVLPISAGDILQWAWNINSATTTSLLYVTEQTVTPYQPTTPSFTVSANLLGGYLPTPGDGCWVMFEGGDPNFPLWLGAF